MGKVLAAMVVSKGDVELLALVIVVACGVTGYRLAISTRQQTGTTPWRLPPIAWGIVAGLFAPWGLLLEFLARLTTRGQRSTQPGPLVGRPQPGRGYGNSYEGQLPGSSLPPPAPPTVPAAGPSNPADGAPPWMVPTVNEPAGPGGWTRASGQPAPLFGWYADPAGRHELRYWDGRSWSDSVADKGAVSKELETHAQWWAWPPHPSDPS